MTSAFFRYSVLRLSLFGGCLALFALAGMFSIWGVVLSALISAVLSWFFLRGPRERMAAGLDEHITRRVEDKQGGAGARRRSRWELDTEAEDAEADAARAEHTPDRA